MAHRYHPDMDSSDAPDAILFDNCEDCKRHTKYLGLSLDKEHWHSMWDRMIQTQFGNDYYRSDNEEKLGSYLYNIYVLKERRYI